MKITGRFSLKSSDDWAIVDFPIIPSFERALRKFLEDNFNALLDAFQEPDTEFWATTSTDEKSVEIRFGYGKKSPKLVFPLREIYSMHLESGAEPQEYKRAAAVLRCLAQDIEEAGKTE